MSENIRELLDSQLAYTDQLLRYFGQDDAKRHVVSIDDCTSLYWFFDGDSIYSDQHLDSLYKRQMSSEVDKLFDGHLRIYKRGSFTLAKANGSFCIWDNAKEIHIEGSVTVPTMGGFHEEIEFFRRRRERQIASEIINSQKWIPEETRYAQDSVRFDMRVSEYDGCTVSIPKGWRLVLFSPKDKA